MQSDRQSEGEEKILDGRDWTGFCCGEATSILEQEINNAVYAKSWTRGTLSHCVDFLLLNNNSKPLDLMINLFSHN